MNVIFTICAKNYLAQAQSLGYSVKKHSPTTDFYILLSDEIGDSNIYCDDFEVIESKSLKNIPNFSTLAFKYNVIEFSTSVKPFFFDWLLNEKRYEKILYLDPDMVVYNSLDFLFEELDNTTALLTPHILKPYVDYQGATTEEELLFVGIYNLGFFGLKNNAIGRQMIEWWKTKLANQCYVDKNDALHVDQRWMDFLPALYGDEVKILRHPGLNVAFWNLHERTISDNGFSYLVNNEDLVIYHFSGLDPETFSSIARKQTKFNLDNRPELRRLFSEYVDELKNNNFENLSVLKYKYNQYNNDIYILQYQRRLFRALLSEGQAFENPFDVNNGTFYHLLTSNKLMIFDKEGKYYALRKGVNNVDAKRDKMLKLLQILKTVVGIKIYYLLMRFMTTYSSFEKQTFLIPRLRK